MAASHSNLKLPPLQPDEYELVLPTGLEFLSDKTSTNEVEFLGYEYDPSGDSLSENIIHLLFRNKGDIFVAVDGVPLVEKTYDEIESMIHDKSEAYHLFRMRDSKFLAPMVSPRSSDSCSFEEQIQQLYNQIEHHEKEIKTKEHALVRHQIELAAAKKEVKRVQFEELKKRQEQVAELKEELGQVDDDDDFVDGRHSRKRKSSASEQSHETMEDNHKHYKYEDGSHNGWMGTMKAFVGL